MENQDIFNSKIKKIRIELPHYSFSHSSSGDSSHDFIGRERILEKLKKLVMDSTDEPGVYLVTGNRGVGKTSLVNEVIKETSLKTKSNLFENLRGLFLMLLAVAVTQSCLQIFDIPKKHSIIFVIVTILILVSSFTLLCFFNGYRQKIHKQATTKKRVWNYLKSAFKELNHLMNPHYPYRKAQYITKIIFIVSFTQIFLICPWVITPTIVFCGYSMIVLGFMCFRHREIISCEYKHKKKNISINDNFSILKKLILLPIWKYIKKHSRLYLRINFGHKLKDEKDILRLIARTLSTEYNKYHRSFRRIFLWRATAFGVLLLLAHLFSVIVEHQEFYKLIKQHDLYQNSSQVFLNDTIYINNSTRLEKANDSICIKVKINDTIWLNRNIDQVAKIIDSILLAKDMARLKCAFSKVDTMVSYLLLVPDQLIFEISKRVNKFPRFLLCKQDKIGLDKKFVLPINYLFWLSFFLIYLFCVLLFRGTWVTQFFVTHRIIMRRLRELNNDITYSTERENSIRINSGEVGPVIETNTKKSRNVADAREIEKELQDILNDMQRIPIVMCRPNVVIVFDELDKIEPDDTDLEKESRQTKASLFSIDATRERQTEILRILSNIKYFLSTANAKFIFIAGREMYDIYLADVSERNNYIGSIFNVVIHVPSFLTDHPTGKQPIPEESGIASLPEEFVCRKLFPHDCQLKSYNLKSYRMYLERKIFCKDTQNTNDTRCEEIQKIIALLQQFIIYLAHVSKGAPKKMMQLFESFVEVRDENDEFKKENTLVVQYYQHSRHFLSFNYYKQYTLGIIAYLITPIFNRLSESNIKEHSDKLLVSSLRFVDFLFKFHKHSFSWKTLELSPELMEVNRAPELRSVAVDLVNYLSQVHINKSNFSLYEYKFDSWIANEFFTMTKTDDVFSALFSFSLDEMLPMKKRYQDLLEKNEKEYHKEGMDDKTSTKYIDAISSLQVVLGDLHYYDDELEEAGVYYKNAVQLLSKREVKDDAGMRKDNDNKDYETMNHEHLYLYVRNKLKLGMIHEKRKQYDFAYMTYGDLCKQIIREQYTKTSSRPLYFKNILPNINYGLFKKMTYEGLKMLYLPFIAKFQILEKSHVGGITRNHLEQLDKEFNFLTYIIKRDEAKILEAEFLSRVADILYYKNSDLKCKIDKNRRTDKDEDTGHHENWGNEILPKNKSCTACYYYHKALSFLLNKPYFNKLEKKNENTIIKLLYDSIKQLNDNYNTKYCTILARILSDWGNVFFSCDSRDKESTHGCYICDANSCNTETWCYNCACYICDINDCETNSLLAIVKKYINYIDSESNKDDRDILLSNFMNSRRNLTKLEIVFAMYSISSEAYRNANLYKRSAYQIYKMLNLFRHYELYKCEKSKIYIKQLSKKAVHYLWHANEDLNALELNKRENDFGKDTIDKAIPVMQYLLVDSEITRIRILVKELEFKLVQNPEALRTYYDMRITSPYKINYSVGARILRLRFKSKVNYKAYELLLGKTGIDEKVPQNEINIILESDNCNDTVKKIWGDYFDIKDVTLDKKREILDNLIAETIFCLIDIVQLSKTMGETYVFTNSFLGSVHKNLSFWIRRYEAYKLYTKGNSKIKELLERYLGEEWRELLSGYRENQQALSYYHKCIEMHKEGRAYHNAIDTLYYIKDDYNDRSDHFNIAEERHRILNGKIKEKIDNIKDIYKDSKLYNVDSYYGIF